MLNIDKPWEHLIEENSKYQEQFKEERIRKAREEYFKEQLRMKKKLEEDPNEIDYKTDRSIEVTEDEEEESESDEGVTLDNIKTG
jgi:hypothetical protein